MTTLHVTIDATAPGPALDLDALTARAAGLLDLRDWALLPVGSE